VEESSIPLRNQALMCRPFVGIMRGAQCGQVLLIVLAVLLAVAASSASFIWFMNQQQTRAGVRYRTTAALRAAEAGIHRAISILESEAPDGTPGREWRPSDHSEPVAVGALRGTFVVSVASEAGGVLVITSEGRVGDSTRRLRARVHLASPALLSALFVSTVVQLERPPAATFVFPYGAGLGDRPWFHIAAGEEIWFAQTRVSLNDPSSPDDLQPGPLDPIGLASPGGTQLVPETIRILLAGDARFTMGPERLPIAEPQLRLAGIRLEGAARRADRLPAVPTVDADYYRALAQTNTANAEINRSAGRFTGDADLERKPDSLYGQDQMARITAYLATGALPADRPPVLRGMVYVQGSVTIPQGSRVHIADGALVADSTVQIGPKAELAVTHTPATRTLPGIIVLGHGALILAPESRLRIHGLVYVNRAFDAAAGASVDIVGALLANDPAIGYRNDAARVVVRYDPAVLGTPGLLTPAGAPVVAWVSRWEELPP